jgi:anti-anti-sigma regulatory factor
VGKDDCVTSSSTDHAAFLYRNDSEQSARLARFVEDGLARNERVLFVSDREHVERVPSMLGDDARAALASGQLRLEDSATTYLAQGHFDGSRMRQHYSDAADRALAAHFAGVPVAADMSWAVDSDTNFNELLAYERSLDDVIAGRPITVLCEYDRRLFDENAVRALIRAHDARDPRPHIEATRDPAGLLLSAEIDIAFREELTEALDALAKNALRAAYIDLRGVHYIDAASIDALAAAAGRLQGGLLLRVNPAIAPIFTLLAPTLPKRLAIEELAK